MASFELYFSDLTEEAQKSFLEKAGLNSAEEGNYDVFPITEIEFDNEDDEEEFEDDNLTKDGVPVNKVTSVEIDSELFFDEISTDVTSWNFDKDDIEDYPEVVEYLEKNEPQALEALRNGEIDYLEVYRDTF